MHDMEIPDTVAAVGRAGAGTNNKTVGERAVAVETACRCNSRQSLEVDLLGQVPVTWRNDAHSKVGLVTDPLSMLADLARVRWRFRAGAYNPESGESPGTRAG